MSETIEEHEAEFIRVFLAEAREIQRKYGVNKTEALEIMIIFELKKIHSHLDGLEASKR
jgi:hypothetical protein